ncbi:transcriptional regulator [Dermabacteraceae bacterium TAE3-ERU27]|nr:transcriptional regulator [Dermabacteraceae bacterium TAE3-ERU27]
MDSANRDQKAFQAAQMYYEEGATMEAISSRLRTSRSTVSRLLTHARDRGLVTISLYPPRLSPAVLEAEIRERFGVCANVVQVNPAASERERMNLVAQVAAKQVEKITHPQTVVGVAWGTTMAAVARQLTPKPPRGIKVVQLNGAVNTAGGGMGHASAVLSQFGRALEAEVHHFVVPAFFDHVNTREWLWRERSTLRVLELQAEASLAIFGAGTFSAGVPSQVYSSGYLESSDIARLREQGVVGDVCTRFLREDGSWQDIEMNRRCSGPSPADLAQIPRRLLVVSGVDKAAALRAALHAATATDLVVDDATAQEMLARGGAEAGR